MKTSPNVVAVALVGFVGGLLGAELSFGRLRKAPAEAPQPLVYSLEVRDSTGELLASPLLVGEQGHKVHLNLSQPPGGPRTPAQLRGESDQPGLQMSLELDPQHAGEEAVCLGYRLSVDAGAPHEGRIGVTYGERQSVKLGGSSPLNLVLTVARANSPAFDKMIRARGRPVI